LLQSSSSQKQAMAAFNFKYHFHINISKYIRRLKLNFKLQTRSDILISNVQKLINGNQSTSASRHIKDTVSSGCAEKIVQENMNKIWYQVKSGSF
jgi:hypothetical protein